MLYMATPNQLVLSPHLLTHPHLHSLPILPSLTATVMKHTFSLCAGTMSYHPTTGTPPPCTSFSLTNISTTKAIMFGGGGADRTLLKDYVQLLDMLSWVGHHCWHMCSMCSCMIHVLNVFLYVTCAQCVPVCYMCSMCSCMIHVYVILCMYTCTYIFVCFSKVSYSVILEICMFKGHCFTDSVFSSAGSI